MNMEMKVQYRVLKRTDVLLRTFEGIAWSSIQCQKGAKFAVHEGNRGPRRLLQGHLYQNGKKKNAQSSIRVQQNIGNKQFRRGGSTL